MVDDVKFPSLGGPGLFGRFYFAQRDAGRSQFGQHRTPLENLIDVFFQDLHTDDPGIEIDVFRKAGAVVVKAQIDSPLQADGSRTYHRGKMPEKHQVEPLDCLPLIHSSIFTYPLI